MKRCLFLLATCFCAAVCAISAHADTSLFGSGGLDPSFCSKQNQRQTVVYIDDMMMIEGKQDWAAKLASKLRATLAPGERITVVRLSPAAGKSDEIWNGCWPEFTAEQRQKIEAGTYLFRKSPISSLPDQKKFFMSDLNGALSTIYLASKRPQSVARVDPQAPPEKNIIRSLAFDEGRFAQSRITIRAIVYSDFAENSDLGSVFKNADQYENYGKKLGTYLRRSVFYGYGMAENITNSASVMDLTRKFWVSALRTMNASVGGLGTDLNVQNAVPISGMAFNVDLKREGQDLDGSLSLLVDADGNLVDSWLQISRLTIVGLTGSFRCQGPTEDQTCRLTAKTSSGLVTQNSEEDIILAGSEHDGLTGQIGIKGALTYTLSATKVEN